MELNGSGYFLPPGVPVWRSGCWRQMNVMRSVQYLRYILTPRATRDRRGFFHYLLTYPDSAMDFYARSGRGWAWDGWWAGAAKLAKRNWARLSHTLGCCQFIESNSTTYRIPYQIIAANVQRTAQRTSSTRNRRLHTISRRRRGTRRSHVLSRCPRTQRSALPLAAQCLGEARAAARAGMHSLVRVLRTLRRSTAAGCIGWWRGRRRRGRGSDLARAGVVQRRLGACDASLPHQPELKPTIESYLRRAMKLQQPGEASAESNAADALAVGDAAAWNQAATWICP